MGRGTRERLNVGFFNGSLLLATLIGVLAESWAAFFVTLVIAVACNLNSKEIRFGGKGKR
jgi:hypothetical protein